MVKKLNLQESNNYSTELDCVEFYSNDLQRVSAEKIGNTIEVQSPIGINIYNVKFEPSHNIVIEYEVNVEDYDPDYIDSFVCEILEGMEDKIRNAKPTWVSESTDDFERYTYVKSKEVYDFDGYLTEYTMYYDEVDDKYVFVFGDSDFYDPNEGTVEFDWECETEPEANEWFNSYTGYDEDLDESLKEDTTNVYDLSPKEIAGLIKDMLSKIKFKPVDLEQSVFDKDGTDTYYLISDKIYKTLGSNFYTETNYPIEISKTPILFKENNRGTISMLFINAGRIWKITKNGKVTTEAINPYSKRDTLIYIYNQLKELKGGLSESTGKPHTFVVDIPNKEVYDFHFKGIDKEGWKRDVDQVIVYYDNHGQFVDLILVDDNGIKIGSSRKKFKIVKDDIVITDSDKNDVIIGHIVTDNNE